MTRRTWIRNAIASRSPRTIRKAPARHRLTLEELEDRCLLSGPDPTVPTSTIIPDITQPNTIFWNGGAPFTTYGVEGIKVPPTGTGTMKTFTITNTSGQTIFPFLEGVNTGQDGANKKLNPNNPNNYYDPQDFNNQEYREYVGYVGTNGSNYLGLPGGASITFVVPLVFWDSGRMFVGTDGTYMTPTNTNGPGQKPDIINNPYNYDSNAQEAISVSGTTNSWVTQYTKDPNGVSSAGLVMFYHVLGGQGAITATGPNASAAAQLTEYTIRDPYLKTAGVPPPSPPGGWLTEPAQTKVIFGYNISNVDNLTAPITMEANNVPVPIPPPDNTNTPTPNYGWIGTQLTADQMNLLISSFVSNAPNTIVNGVTYPNGLLGSYFAANPGPNVNGPGWPQYNSLPGGVLKIPGGDNIFLDSPLNGKNSIYNTFGKLNQTLLSSGGTAPLSTDVPGPNTSISSETQTTFNLTFPTDGGKSQARWFQNLEFMLGKTKPFNQVNVTATPADSTGLPPLVIGTVADYQNDPTTPTLTLNLTGGSIPKDYVGTTPGLTGTRPINDYAATRIRDLWYSWANFYHDLFTFQPFQASGSVAIQGDGVTQAAVLTLNSAPTTPLAVGMTVGDIPGQTILPTNAPPVTILRLIDSTHAYLSQFPTNPGSGTFVIGPPPFVPFGDPTGINSVTIKDPGLGYKPGTVSFIGGSGVGAAGTLLTSNGAVVGVAITNPGSGYNIAAPTLQFSGGTGASGTAVVNAQGQVVGVTNLIGGSGFLSINFSGNSGVATGIATVDGTGKITNIIVTNTGTGYVAGQARVIISGGSPTKPAIVTPNVGPGFTPVFTTLTQDPNLPFSPTQFAASVFEVMEAEGGSPNFMLKQPLLPASMSLMHYVIGAITDTLPNSNGGASAIGRLVTNLIISTLDGVPDYTNPDWQKFFYPAPATATSGQFYNVYSLDPYVWFVHDVLNMSGYGFSVDDGSSFVNAQGSDFASTLTVPSSLQVVFSGIGNVPNTQPWYPSTPYGTITGMMATITNGTDTNGNPVSFLNIQNATDPATIQAFWQVNANDPAATGHVGAYAWATPIKPGTFVIKKIVGVTPTNPTGLQFQLSQVTTAIATPFSVTFTGANKAPQLTSPPPGPPPSPPPSAPPSNNRPGPSNTQTPIQQVVELTQDELLLTLTQFVFSLEQAVGLPPDPALVAALAAYQNAILLNPLDPTLLGQIVNALVHQAIVNLVTSGLLI